MSRKSRRPRAHARSQGGQYGPRVIMRIQAEKPMVLTYCGLAYGIRERAEYPDNGGRAKFDDLGKETTQWRKLSLTC